MYDMHFSFPSEEEDSVPYRIVDLNTNISCDASGYTFLEERKEEENPYMKLQPKCIRTEIKVLKIIENRTFDSRSKCTPRSATTIIIFTMIYLQECAESAGNILEGI